MGLLRLYLAVCVVADHAGPLGPWVVHNGHEAVEIFFMISGFYMSLISPKYHSIRQFYVSRFLRIFVPYWVTLAIVLVVSIGTGVLIGNWLELTPYLSQPFQKNGPLGVVFATIVNLTVFFQDWIMFLKHDFGSPLMFTSDFRENVHPLFTYLLIPQAWTVSIELFFYLLFPFMNKLKSHTLVFILLGSLLARIFTYEVLKLNSDPWDYRFFPFEIAFFVMGMLIFRAYSFLTPSPSRHVVKNPVVYFLISAMLILLFIAAKLASDILAQSLGVNYARLLFYLLWAGMIPLLFHFFKTSKIDRFLGELSYPIYLIHIIIILLIKIGLDSFHLSMTLLGPVSAVVTVMAAVVFYVLIVKRLEETRSQLVARQV
jgi:peptidoglycan/LPS O-acetylase OafA/YrhL